MGSRPIPMYVFIGVIEHVVGAKMMYEDKETPTVVSCTGAPKHSDWFVEVHR